jgi:hypothetical protein
MRRATTFLSVLCSANAYTQARRIEGVQSQPVTILGLSSYAHDCQRAAEASGHKADGMRNDLTSCNLAISRAGMSTEDRASTYLHRGIVHTYIPP